jgi:hypothetical protein
LKDTSLDDSKEIEQSPDAPMVNDDNNTVDQTIFTPIDDNHEVEQSATDAVE